jgi:hypothetical protein
MGWLPKNIVVNFRHQCRSCGKPWNVAFEKFFPGQHEQWYFMQCPHCFCREIYGESGLVVRPGQDCARDIWDQVTLGDKYQPPPLRPPKTL